MFSMSTFVVATLKTTPTTSILVAGSQRVRKTQTKQGVQTETERKTVT